MLNNEESENNATRVSRWAFSRWGKYLLVLLLFLAWIAFLDQNNLVKRAGLRSELRALEREKAYYIEKIKEDERKIDELQGDRDKLEKFAREQYLMKRPDEDLFIIVDD